MAKSDFNYLTNWLTLQSQDRCGETDFAEEILPNLPCIYISIFNTAVRNVSDVV
jgi:hypothetical protein